MSVGDEERQLSAVCPGGLAALLGVCVATWVTSCSLRATVPDPGLEGLALASVEPAVVVPGSLLVLEGDSFVDPFWGDSRLRLRGAVDGTPLDITLPLTFVDYDHLTAAVDDAFFAALGGVGDFSGEALVEVRSTTDGKLYSSARLPISLGLRDELVPALGDLQSGGLIFVNDAIAVSGAGLLLGGSEGTSFAVVSGCFTATGAGECTPVEPIEVAVSPELPYARDRGTFPFAPAIAGIEPGVFTGTVALRNRHTVGPTPESDPLPADYEIIPPAVFAISTTTVSLGQYVDVSGGGFVGGDAQTTTLLHLVGTYTSDGGGAVPVDRVLVPAFSSGRLVRYVLNENDSLGQALDLRHDTGTFVGTVTPETRYGGIDVVGDGAETTLSIAPVRQVVWLDFQPSYVESLRNYGLRAADSLIRERVREVVAHAYRTINVDLRSEEPTDYALYAIVEVHGLDPNEMGLFGYDNSPGKDTDNLRLFDRLGGVNAMTQEDGYAGYGGVFIDSLFGFSTHPGNLADEAPGSDAAFDATFDPFRPDTDGAAVVAADFADELPSTDGGAACPATDRPTRVSCAIWVLGSLIGGTLSHELGHSLGLANPYGEGFHDSGDAPRRLMDGGSDRPFLERAELFGQGPGDFCDDEYRYLRTILPTPDADDTTPRASCF